MLFNLKSMDHKQILTKLLKPYLIMEPFYAPSSKEQQFSAVALILRNTSKPQQQMNSFKELQAMLNTEILLLQRISNNKIYSGQICFPGGKCEQEQSMVDTAIRQTEEETNLKLSSQDLVGVMNNKLIAYRRAKTILYTYAVVFYQRQQQEVKLNKEEMADYQWIPLRYFMNDQVYQPIVLPLEVFSYLIHQFQNFAAIKHFQWPAINVKMSKNLYGLTLYILGQFVSRLNIRLQVGLQKLINKINGDNKDSLNSNKLKKIARELQEIQKYGAKLRDLYFIELRIVWKENCILSIEQKKNISNSFIQKLRTMFPHRSHL